MYLLGMLLGAIVAAWGSQDAGHMMRRTRLADAVGDLPIHWGRIQVCVCVRVFDAGLNMISYTKNEYEVL